jgi:hypothetical protein
MSHCAHWRRLCVTNSGRMGFVAPLAEVGDLVCVVYGMQAPFVLRPKFDDELKDMTYKIVGECYIHGVMDGEVMTGGEKEDTWFNIV